jgi:pentatricopeptide repeat protein
LIVEAWPHPGSDRLWCKRIDVGEEAPREIASELRENYASSEELQDRKVLVLCNHRSTGLLGFKSSGLVLCASSSDGSKVELVEPLPTSKVGERVFLGGAVEERPMLANPAGKMKMQQRKIFEQVAGELLTNESREVEFQGHAIRTSAGPCSVLSITNGPIVPETFLGAGWWKRGLPLNVRVEKAKAMLEDARGSAGSPDPVLYHMLLMLYTLQDDVESANALRECMRREEVPYVQGAYSELLKMQRDSTKSVEGLRSVMALMESVGAGQGDSERCDLLPAYYMLMQLSCQDDVQGGKAAMRGVMQEMQARGIVHSRARKKKSYEMLLQLCVKLDETHGAREVLQEMKEAGIKYSPLVWDTMMHLHIKRGDILGTEKVMEEMKEAGMKLTQGVHNTLLMLYIKLRDADGAIAQLEERVGRGEPCEKGALYISVLNLCVEYEEDAGWDDEEHEEHEEHAEEGGAAGDAKVNDEGGGEGEDVEGDDGEGEDVRRARRVLDLMAQAGAQNGKVRSDEKGLAVLLDRFQGPADPLVELRSLIQAARAPPGE